MLYVIMCFLWWVRGILRKINKIGVLLFIYPFVLKTYFRKITDVFNQEHLVTSRNECDCCVYLTLKVLIVISIWFFRTVFLAILLLYRLQASPSLLSWNFTVMWNLFPSDCYDKSMSMNTEAKAHGSQRT